MSGKRADATALPAVSVIVVAYLSERWGDLCEAVASVRRQTVPATELVVVIDHHHDLLVRARAEFPYATVIPNEGSRGASGARNIGVVASTGEVVAFLDDDAAASPTWLEALLAHFSSPEVVGVGGSLSPVWARSRPAWFPPEFDWAVGASYRGMPEQAAPVRNVWSGNMAIRRQVFEAIGGFRDDFGKVGERHRPEDTDLCLRASAVGRGTWIYEPGALASHRVPAYRAGFGYFLHRCVQEGLGKAALAALNGVSQSTSAERRYARRVLSAGFARGLRETARGDATGGLRSAAIATGFFLAAAGFLAGRVVGAVQAAAGRSRQPVPDERDGRDGREEAMPGAYSR